MLSADMETSGRKVFFSLNAFANKVAGARMSTAIGSGARSPRSPPLSPASDATKQRVAEGVLLQAVLFDAFVTVSKGKPAQMTTIKGVINGNVRSAFHLDLSKLKLTNNGLRV